MYGQNGFSVGDTSLLSQTEARELWQKFLETFKSTLVKYWKLEIRWQAAIVTPAIAAMFS